MTTTTLPRPDRLCLKWTPDRTRWVHAGRIVRAVRLDPSGHMVIELWRRGLPAVAYMGQSIWQDANGREWRVTRTDTAGDVLALWMERSEGR